MRSRRGSTPPWPKMLKVLLLDRGACFRRIDFNPSDGSLLTWRAILKSQAEPSHGKNDGCAVKGAFDQPDPSIVPTQEPSA